MKTFKAMLLATSVIMSSLSFAANGEVDGGGGGTLPANPVGIYQIEDHIYSGDAKSELRQLARIFEWSHMNTKIHEEYSKLFDGSRTLFDVIEETQIEIRKDRPCHDKYGNEKDASIYADREDAFCLSAFRIAPKFTEDNMARQVSALILHELTHFLGFDEDEANRVQRLSIHYLRDLRKHELQNSFAFFSGLVQQTKGRVNVMIQSIEENRDYEENVLRSAKVLFDRLNDLDNEMGEKQIKQPLREEAEQYFRYIKSLSLVSTWAAKIKLGEDPYGYLKDYMENTFGARNEMTYGEFLEKQDLKLGNHTERMLAMPFFKIESRDSFLRYSKLVKNFLDSLDKLLFAMNRRQSVVGIELLPRVGVENVWAKFLGSYNIDSFECQDLDGKKIDSPLNWTSIDVIENTSFEGVKVYLRFRFQNGFSEQPFYAGAFSSNGGYAVVSETEIGKASLSSAGGDLWSERYHKKDYSMEEVLGGFEFNVQNYLLDQNSARKSESGYSCSYKLSKH